jgi:hypothetical protein
MGLVYIPSSLVFHIIDLRFQFIYLLLQALPVRRQATILLSEMVNLGCLCQVYLVQLFDNLLLPKLVLVIEPERWFPDCVFASIHVRIAAYVGSCHRKVGRGLALPGRASERCCLVACSVLWGLGALELGLVKRIRGAKH